MYKYHTKSATVPLRLTDTCFASGSIDGTIVVWSYQQDAWHQLWEYVDPKAEDKTFSTSIQAMLPLAEVILVITVTSRSIDM